VPLQLWLDTSRQRSAWRSRAYVYVYVCMYVSPSTCASAVGAGGAAELFEQKFQSLHTRLTFTPRCREPTFDFERKGITLSYVGMGRPEEQPPAPLMKPRRVSTHALRSSVVVRVVRVLPAVRVYATLFEHGWLHGAGNPRCASLENAPSFSVTLWTWPSEVITFNAPSVKRISFSPSVKCRSTCPFGKW
jgi:hypothetical protein